MALYQTTSGHRANAELARSVELVCFALVVAHAVFFATAYVEGLLAPDSAGAPSDFVNVWAAGRLVLSGHPAAAYDWPTHKLIEESVIAHQFDGYLAWPYPPTFLFAASALALLPYTIAYFAWISGTFLAYLAAVRAIIGDRIGYMLAAAFPGVLSNAMVGQNGFLTAGLIGGTLTLLERRPIAAGALLGLLTFKPHLGVLFPIALMADGRWRALASASLVAALLAAASWLMFGSASWDAFFTSLGDAPQTFMSDHWANWSKFQTAFGLTRVLGGSKALAWTVQITVAVLAAAATFALWRSRTAYEIKAAALVTATLLATPYLYIYDLVVLAVPLAFLFRLGRARGFLAGEAAGIGAACLLILIFPLVKTPPLGFVAVVVVAALIARRALAPRDVPI
jgi:arabinofuranan 3-O-arabinosyltransferase